MWRPSIGGPILLGFVIVAAILLIAGFGMPVGVGLLVGLVLGAVVGVGTGLWIGLKARGGPMSFDSYATLTSDDGPQVDLQAVTASMERVQRVDHGDLVRIVPGGATSDAGGFRVELIAVSRAVQRRRMSKLCGNVGPGGGGIAAATVGSEAAWRRASSRRRLSSPRAIAQ